MPKLPGISQRDAVRVFERLGYRIARQSGHIVMSNGKAIDVEWFVRDAIDATVRAWKGTPVGLSDTSANPIANADQTLEMPTIPGDDAKE